MLLPDPHCLNYELLTAQCDVDVDVLLHWQDFTYPENVAFPVGGPGAGRHIVIEMHYDNPKMEQGELINLNQLAYQGNYAYWLVILLITTLFMGWFYLQVLLIAQEWDFTTPVLVENMMLEWSVLAILSIQIW